jgi:hypothetical protein
LREIRKWLGFSTSRQHNFHLLASGHGCWQAAMIFCAFLNKGSSKTPLKTFWENPCQKLLAEKVERKKNVFPFIFSHGVFVRFSTRGVQKHYKKLFGESPCQKLLAEKVEKKKSFSCRLFPSILFYRVFGRFSA